MKSPCHICEALHGEGENKPNKQHGSMAETVRCVLWSSEGSELVLEKVIGDLFA